MIWNDWEGQMVKDSRECGEATAMGHSKGLRFSIRSKGQESWVCGLLYLKGHGCQDGMENNFPADCVAASMVYRSGIAVA